MRKFGIVGLSILLLSIVGYFGYQRYAQAKLMASIRPLVKNASLRVNNAVAYELETRRITVKEAIERLETDIVEIEKKILDVQSLATSNAKEKTDVVIAYLKDAQELLRVILATHRKALAFRSANEEVRRLLKFNPESSIELSYYKKSSQKALDDYTEKLREAKESVREVDAVTRKFLEKRAQVSAVLPTDVLAELPVIERFLKELEETFPKTLEEGSNTEKTRKVPLFATDQRKSKGGVRKESKAEEGRPDQVRENLEESRPDQVREKLIQSALERVRNRAETGTGKGNWAVQVNAFPDEAEAISLANTLANKGYDAYVVPTTIKGRTYYRVRVGSLATHDEAKELEKILRTKENLTESLTVSR